MIFDYIILMDSREWEDFTETVHRFEPSTRADTRDEVMIRLTEEPDLSTNCSHRVNRLRLKLFIQENFRVQSQAGKIPASCFFREKRDQFAHNVKRC